MPTIFPYSCPLSTLAVGEQHRRLDRYASAWAAAWGDAWRIAKVVQDDDAAAQRQFLCRPGGCYLVSRSDRGDVLLFPSCLVLGRCARDLWWGLKGFLARGVQVAMLDLLPRVLSEGEAELLHRLSMLEGFDAHLQAVEATAKKRALGKLLCQSCPPGFRVVGRKGHRRVVEDPQEQQVIAEIVEWRRQGLSLDAIHLRLLERRVRTPAGRPWSRTRIDEASKHLLATQA